MPAVPVAMAIPLGRQSSAPSRPPCAPSPPAASGPSSAQSPRSPHGRPLRGKGTPSVPQRPPGPLLSPPSPLTPHLDVLGDLDELHLGGHVPQRAHALAQVLVADVAILVRVELLEGIQQLWAWPRVGTGTSSGVEGHMDTVSPSWTWETPPPRSHPHEDVPCHSPRPVSPPRHLCSPSSSSGDRSRSCMGHTEGVTAE